MLDNKVWFLALKEKYLDKSFSKLLTKDKRLKLWLFTSFGESYQKHIAPCFRLGLPKQFCFSYVPLQLLDALFSYCTIYAVCKEFRHLKSIVLN